MKLDDILEDDDLLTAWAINNTIVILVTFILTYITLSNG